MNPHDYITTFTGRQFYPLEPSPDDICIEDIAHSLANTCRFGGHCRTFYSVAQHSILVSKLVPRRIAMVGLLHDATEAYIGDMVSPLKQFMEEYKEVEANIWLAVAERFGLPDEILQDVKLADNLALMMEMHYLINNKNLSLDLLSWSMRPHSPQVAECSFLQRFSDL